MPKTTLTDTGISSLQYRGTRIDMWDSKLPAFGLRVGKESKTFIVKHANRRFTLGRYPSMSLAEARQKARHILISEPVKTSDLTFAQALDIFVKTHCASKKERTGKDYENTLRRHFSGFNPKKLSALSTERVMSVIDDLVERPSEANHAFQYARTFFKWCVRRRYIDRSPLEGFGLPAKTKARSRVLTDDELRKIWKSCTGQFGNVVRLCILHGHRRGEISLGLPSWATDKLTIPADVTKNGREHTLPLSAFARKFFTAPFPRFAWSREKRKLDKKSGVKDWTLHDLRRTFATNLAKLGTPIHVTEKILNHVSGTHGGIVGVYQLHSYEAEIKTAMEQWEAKVRAMCR